MKKIDSSYFKKLTKNIIIDNCIPELSSKNVHEFKIGKNFFYEVKDYNELKYIQKIINKKLQKGIPLNNAAVAFREKFSYLHLFELHRKNYYFLRLDIRSFFHSIQIDDVKKVLQEYFKDEYINEKSTQTIIDGFLNLVSYKIPDNSSNKEEFKGKKVIPMGFITSPTISNIIFRKLDIQIQKYCAEKNIVYTRYADDMLFSSDKISKYVHSQNFEGEISILISQLGFKLNKHKTIKKEHTISLNGYTIQYSDKGSRKGFLLSEKVLNEFRLSNKKINIIKKIIHMINVEDKSHTLILKKLFNYKLPMSVPKAKKSQFEKNQLVHKIAGYRSYILSFIIFNKKYNCLQDNTLKKYMNLVNKLNSILEKLNA